MITELIITSEQNIYNHVHVKTVGWTKAKLTILLNFSW